MVPLELQAGHPASRYRLSRAQCPSLASSRFALNTSITRRTDILDPHTLAEATPFLRQPKTLAIIHQQFNGFASSVRKDEQSAR